MAKGVRAGRLALRTAQLQDKLVEMVLRKEEAGYYTRPRPARTSATKLVKLTGGVVKRVRV